MPNAPEGLLDQLVEALTCLPGVGTKTAQRMAFHLLERHRPRGRALAAVLDEALEKIRHCSRCRNFTEHELCSICADPQRTAGQLCVVEGPADVRLLEANTEYQGRYFVLMGRLSPLDGIGPDEIGLPQLEERLRSETVREIILAMGTTVESDVTAHVLSELGQRHGAAVTRLARGVPVGGELEYLDSGTLATAFEGRTRY